MKIKDGAAHLRALDKDREVYLDGALITRVVDHPAFATACRTAAALYDFQAAPANVELMTFETETGRRVNRAWQMPRSYAELVTRREALTAWAELHGGFLGRSPDHLASSLAGQVMGIEVFERHGARFAGALRDYFAYARDNDLYLTYVIVNPQGDRSKAWGEQASEEMTMRVVDEDAEGVTVRGAKMLGTGSVMAEEILVANLQPLKPGEERFAISFALPLDARGIKVLSRKSYEASAVSPWDNPLSHRFDENDSVIYFDDVKVPRERIFLLGDTDMCRAQFHDTPGHIFQNYQSQIRLVVKLKFLLALARRMAETIGTAAMPPVMGQLGEMASEVATVEGLLYGMESAGGETGGYYLPNAGMIYAAQVYTQALYPRFIDHIRSLAGGALIMLPSSAADLENPAIAPLIESTQVSARPGEGATERMTLMKLAWDAVGSEFAGRHTQYEMFYAGAKFVTTAHCFRRYDWAGAERILEGVLASNEEARPAGARKQSAGGASGGA